MGKSWRETLETMIANAGGSIRVKDLPLSKTFADYLRQHGVDFKAKIEYSEAVSIMELEESGKYQNEPSLAEADPRNLYHRVIDKLNALGKKTFSGEAIDKFIAVLENMEKDLANVKDTDEILKSLQNHFCSNCHFLESQCKCDKPLTEVGLANACLGIVTTDLGGKPVSHHFCKDCHCPKGQCRCYDEHNEQAAPAGLADNWQKLASMHEVCTNCNFTMPATKDSIFCPRCGQKFTTNKVVKIPKITQEKYRQRLQKIKDNIAQCEREIHVHREAIEDNRRSIYNDQRQLRLIKQELESL